MNNLSIEERKRLMVEELKNLHKTMINISLLWDYDDVMDDDLKISNKYPFQESFDIEVDEVELWVKDVEKNYKLNQSVECF